MFDEIACASSPQEWGIKIFSHFVQCRTAPKFEIPLCPAVMLIFLLLKEVLRRLDFYYRPEMFAVIYIVA